MEVLNLIGILRIKDENGEWQEIQAIKGTPGQDGKDYVLTQTDKQEIAGLVDLVDYSTTEQMNEAIGRSKYNIGQGLMYNQQDNSVNVRLMNSGRLILNNGMLDVRQEGLFVAQNNRIIFEETVDNVPIVAGVNTLYEFEPDIPLEEFHAFMNQMLQQPQQLMITLRMGQQMGFSNTVVPEMMVQTEMPNGKFYNAIFNLTGVLGPNIQQVTGITELYIGAINQKYDLIIVSNGTAVPPITYVSMSQFSSNPSLAHFWPGNGFRRYNNGN